MVADILDRADIQSANALSTIPRLPSLEALLEEISIGDEASDPQGSGSLYNFPSTWNQDKPQVQSYAQILDIRVVEQLSKLQRLSWYLRSNQTSFEPKSSYLWLSDTVYSVQRAFMLLSDEFRDTPGLDQSCCIAGLIYVECFLQHVNPNAKILEMLNQRLQASIVRCKSAFEYERREGRSRLLLWNLFVGAVSSKHVDWYILELASLIPSIDMPRWEGVEGILTDIAFAETVLHIAKDVWVQVTEIGQQSDQRRREI